MANIYAPTHISMRSYLSSHHLWSARHFIDLAKGMEEEFEGRSTFNIQHRSYVLGAIFCSAAFFDAAINEIYQDANDCHDSYINPLGSKAICSLEKTWRETEGQGKYMRLLDKYQRALDCIGHNRFHTGRAIYQDAAIAINLRNALVHYKPETLTYLDPPVLEKKLRHKLKGKYPTNKFMKGSKNPFFPDHCLGYGCSAWILDTLITFADEFFLIVGIIPNYQRVVLDHPNEQPC